MQWDRNDEIHSQLSEPLCVLLGPEAADALRKHFTGSVLDCQDYIAERAIIRAKPKDRSKRTFVFPAPRTAKGDVLEFAHRARTARTSEMRIGCQGNCTSRAKVGAAVGKKVPTPDADGRINELSQSASKIEEHDAPSWNGIESVLRRSADASSWHIGHRGDDSHRPFRRLHQGFGRHKERVLQNESAAQLGVGEAVGKQ
jgi:hypothetical protein